MARHFSGADSIVCDVGACGPLAQGSYTMIWLYKIDLFVGFGGLGSLYGGATQRRQGMVTGNKLFGTGDFSSGFPASPLPEETWLWAAEYKDAGSAPIRWGWLAYGDDPVNTVFGQASDAANHGDALTPADIVNIGKADVQGQRAMALQAYFEPRLTQAQIRSAFTTALADVMALDPAGCWPLNQASAADPVPDVTNNGADSNTVSGTTIVADPPGYDYSLFVNDVTLGGAIPLPTGAMALTVTDTLVLGGAIPLPRATMRIIPPATELSWAYRIEQGNPVWQAGQEGEWMAIEAGLPVWRISQG